MSGYIFEHNGTQFTPDGTIKVSSTEQHNREVEAQELARWAQGPDRWQGYIDHPDFDEAWRKTSNHLSSHATAMYRAYPRVTIKTWLGTLIGTGKVTGLSSGFNQSRIVHIRIRGTNGATYIGKYGVDGGSFIRLRKAK